MKVLRKMPDVFQDKEKFARTCFQSVINSTWYILFGLYILTFLRKGIIWH